MPSIVEATGTLSRKLIVDVPADQIESKVEERLKSLSRTIRLRGFRPGKAPFKVVQQQYGEQVRQEVLGDVLQASYAEAVTEQKLNPAGMPQIEPEVMEAGKDFRYVAILEVYPEIELKLIEGVRIERPKVNVDEADIERVIDRVRKQSATWESVERGAIKGDKVTVDFKGTIGGEIFEGGAAEGFSFEIGSGQMLEGFETAVLNHKAGDDFSFDLTFPDEYRAQELKGKAAAFAVTLKTVEEPRLPELNDEFAVKVGIAEGGVDKLREEIRGNLSKEVERAVVDRVKNQVLSKLLEINPIEVPNALVNNEIDRLKKDAAGRFGMPASRAGELPREIFESKAKDRVALGLVVAKLIEQHELTVNSERLEKFVEDMVKGFDNPKERAKSYLNDQQTRRALEAMVLEEQVVDWLLEKADTIDLDMSFEQLMSTAANSSEE